jgi:carbon monoxide dehydrogenase subunit G
MIRLITRQFEVPIPLADAWRELADVETWPRWAAHIQRIDVTPPGAVGPDSAGTIRLRNGISSTFRMQEFRPSQNWKWVGPFLWLTVHYDHQFEALGPSRTRLTWVIDADGFGVTLLGRVFAAVYSKNLDKAILAFVTRASDHRRSL